MYEDDSMTTSSPIDGSSKASPIDGSSKSSPIDGSSKASPIDASSGSSPIDASSGSSPIDGSSGTSPIDASSGSSPIDAALREHFHKSMPEGLVSALRAVPIDHIYHRLGGLDQAGDDEYAVANPQYFTDPGPFVICENDDFVVLHKPWAYKMDCDLNRRSSRELSVADWFRAKYPASEYKPCHQLDFATSGVLALAKNRASARFIGIQFESRTLSKNYLAILVGHYKQPSNEIKLHIGDGPNQLNSTSQFRQEVLGPTATSKLSITKIIPLELGHIDSPEGKSFPVTKVLFQPITGRTHQLRVTAKHIGHPILGDYIYGDSEAIEINKTFYRL